uniref:BPL/LPL catalytic domain-containing protein n=1 Tax=uncultured prokaryote TaxID=198431 RepID=A0A0H5PWI3_9ZZZZ|nr:hypothetical protein [uncultured prokaryote]
MKYITLPEEKTRRLSFYLAMEEFVAYHIDEQDCFFMWQVEPSVIFGRNQLIENEVNIPFCRQHGIQTFRRKSGGGCVYADMSNVMFSYITKDEAVGFTFNKYINMVVLVLRKMGVDAKATGRNDVMIDGRKVSGNAFYHIAQRGKAGSGRNIVHGTMLYDTDMENMVGAITPSDAKLVSKGVASVRQRIALLKDYTTMGLGDFKAFVRSNLCNGEIHLTHDDVSVIEEMEKEYLSDDFIYGKDKNGNYRELHTKEAAEAIDYTVLDDYRTDYEAKKNEAVQLVSCPLFTTAVYDLNEAMTLDYSDLDSFVILIALKGEGEILTASGETHSFREGECVLLPATTDTVKVSGEIKFLETFV